MLITLDNLCRLVIPYQIRNEMGIKKGDTLEIELDKNKNLILRSTKINAHRVNVLLEQVKAEMPEEVQWKVTSHIRAILELMEV